MNKYQEALEGVCVNVGEHRENSQFMDWESTLQKLVDRATPINMNSCEGLKPCPKCGEFIMHPLKFCYVCGQSFEWKNESEKEK